MNIIKTRLLTFSTHDMSNCMVFLIAGYLFFNPFPHVTAFKEIFFYTALGLAIFIGITKKGGVDIQTPLSFVFLLILLWSVICIPYAVNKTNTLHDIYAHLIKYLIFYFLIVSFFNTRGKITLLCWTIILSTACFCIWSTSYFYLFLGHPIHDLLGVDVFQEIPTNIIGIVTVFGTLVSLQLLNHDDISQYGRFTLIFVIGLMVLTTLLTQSRGAILALTCVLALLSFRNKYVLILTVIMIILLFVLPIKGRLTSDAILNKMKKDPRIKIARTYIEVVKDHPIQGIGFGMQSYAENDFLKVYHERVDPTKRTETIIMAPHNYFIDILVRLGIIGLVLYLYLLYKTMMTSIRMATNKEDKSIRDWGLTLSCALVAFLIQGMFENVHSGPPAIVFYTLLALITVFWRLQEGSGDRKRAMREKACSTYIPHAKPVRSSE